MCERNGWSFEHSFGDQSWLDGDSLFAWLRDSDAIVLWYDDDRRSGASAGAPLAIGTRRPVFVNDAEWFKDLPERASNLHKLHTPEQLEEALREQLASPFADDRTWDRVAGSLLADYGRVLACGPARTPRARSRLRAGTFVALDHKRARRLLRSLRAGAPGSRAPTPSAALGGGARRPLGTGGAGGVRPVP